jgi:small subunit ribosomal protein S1
MDRNRNNVVLSRRVVLEEGRKHERAEILGKLTKGQILPGVVSSIVDFGAFVDLGGIDGLVHISELSWSHVNHPSEVIKVGDEVNVQVLDVDMDRERISLGLKQTTEDPWKMLVQQYPIGSIIEGKVTKLVPFGAFVELGDGIEGLVHISEMARGHVETPEQVTEVGQDVHVKVMDVDLDRRRISLSMRAAGEALGTVIELPSKEELEAAAAEAAEGVEVEEAAEEAAEPEVEVEEAAEEAVEEAAEEAAEPEAEVAAEPEAEEAAEEAAEPEVEVEEAAEEAAEPEVEVEEAAEEAAEPEAEEAVEEAAESEAEEAAEEAAEPEVEDGEAPEE